MKPQYTPEYDSTPPVELNLGIIEFSQWLKEKMASLKPSDLIDTRLATRILDLC